MLSMKLRKCTRTLVHIVQTHARTHIFIRKARQNNDEWLMVCDGMRTLCVGYVLFLFRIQRQNAQIVQIIESTIWHMEINRPTYPSDSGRTDEKICSRSRSLMKECCMCQARCFLIWKMVIYENFIHSHGYWTVGRCEKDPEWNREASKQAGRVSERKNDEFVVSLNVCVNVCVHGVLCIYTILLFSISICVLLCKWRRAHEW